RDAGAAPPPTSAEPGDETAVLVAEFAGYLAGERGLRPQTIVLYSSAARRFLNSLPDDGDGILAGLTADAVPSFVIAESGRARAAEDPGPRGPGAAAVSAPAGLPPRSGGRARSCGGRLAPAAAAPPDPARRRGCDPRVLRPGHTRRPA